MDRIRLTGLRARGHHGVFDHERADGQAFVVDLEVPLDLAPAGTGDALADTVDYGVLAEEAVAVIEGEPFDLIESVAQAIARRCLAHCPAITVTVHKPQAPIPHAFDDVSVTVTRTREGWDAEAAGRSAAVESDAVVAGDSASEAPEPAPAGPDAAAAGGLRAVLALGANLGDARAALLGAVAALDRHPHIAVLAGSHIYRTAPVGGVEQPDFLNAAVVVDTALTPAELLGVAQGIEIAGHRTREVRWGPRTLDIDLIRCTPAGFDPDDPDRELRLTRPRLELPHPRAAERAFVLAPWRDIAPAARVRLNGPDGSGETLTLDDALARAADADGIERTSDVLWPPAREAEDPGQNRNAEDPGPR